MTNKSLGLLAGTLTLAGFALLYQEPGGGLWRALSIALVVVPVSLTAGFTTRRGRRQRHEDDPSSVEYQASRQAGAQGSVDAMLLVGLLVVVLVLRPTHAPALWAMLCLALIVGDYWLRYANALRSLRG